MGVVVSFCLYTLRRCLEISYSMIPSIIIFLGASLDAMMFWILAVTPDALKLRSPCRLAESPRTTRHAWRRRPVPRSWIAPTMSPRATAVGVKRGGIGAAAPCAAPFPLVVCRCTGPAMLLPAAVVGFRTDTIGMGSGAGMCFESALEPSSSRRTMACRICTTPLSLFALASASLSSFNRYCAGARN